MGTKQSTVDYLLQQMVGAGEVAARKMFGEYAIYCDNKVVALVCEDQLFVKPTLAGEDFIGKCIEGIPYPGAKPYFLIEKEKWENRSWLSKLIRITADELPSKKKKS